MTILVAMIVFALVVFVWNVGQRRARRVPTRSLDSYNRPPDGLLVGTLTNEEIGWLAFVGLLPWAEKQHAKRLEDAQRLLEEAEAEEKKRKAEQHRREAEQRRLEAEAVTLERLEKQDAEERARRERNEARRT